MCATYEAGIGWEMSYVVVFNFCLLAMLVRGLGAAEWFVRPASTLKTSRGTPGKVKHTFLQQPVKGRN